MRKLQVIATPQGWLGNQLFCVFAALQYAGHRNADLSIETNYGFQRNKKWCTTYELFDLPLLAPYKVISTQYEITQKVKRLLIRKSTFFQWLFSTKFVTERDFFCKAPSYIQTLILDDCFNNYSFVSKFHGSPISFSDQDNAEELYSTNIIAMHVRVYEKDDTDYTYEDQIHHLREFIISSTYSSYHIFSNEIDRVQQSLQDLTDREIIFSNKRSAKQDLVEMSRYRNIFMFGSTFSWWAAFSFSKQKNIYIPFFTLNNPSGGFFFPNVEVLYYE